MLEGAATTAIGIQSVINITLSLLLIAVSWWALQAIKFDLFIRNVNSGQAKLIHILLAILIGHGAARFLIDYMQWSNHLLFLF